MKLLIASDIHGSYYYAQKVCDAFALHQCDTLLLLGDILYHGPRNDLPKEYAPKKVIPLLNTMKDKIIAVRGNCEAEVDQMVLEFPCMDTIKTIPMEDYTIHASHGHIYNPDHLPEMQANDVFMFGHIHVPVMEVKEHVHIINPGSITIPKNNSAHSYGVLENHTFTLYDENHHPLSEYTF